MEINLHIEGADKLKAAFAAAPGVAHSKFMDALEKVAYKVERDAKRDAPVGKGYSHGGNLRQSIRTVKYGTTGFVVYVNALYGVFVDQGTRPHVILPKRKARLAFQKDGRWIFAKRVNHPGTKAQPFFSNAVDEAGPFATKTLSDAADDVFNSIAM